MTGELIWNPFSDLILPVWPVLLNSVVFLVSCWFLASFVGSRMLPYRILSGLAVWHGLVSLSYFLEKQSPDFYLETGLTRGFIFLGGFFACMFAAGGFYQKLWNGIIAWGLLYLTEQTVMGLSSGAVCLLLPETLRIVQLSWWFFGMKWLALLLGAIILKGLVRMKPTGALPVQEGLWFCIPFILFWCLLVFSAASGAFEFTVSKKTGQEFITLIKTGSAWQEIAVVFFCVFLVSGIYFLVHVYATADFFWLERQKNSFFQGQLNAQHNYIKEQKECALQTSGFRHDVKNHLRVLSGLLEEKQFQTAKSYLEQLECAANLCSASCYTGIAALDALLAQKLKEAEIIKEQVEIQLSACTQLTISEFDLCLIFANAMDNAAQASKQIPKSIRFLRITAQKTGNFLTLTFQNRAKQNKEYQPGQGLLNIKTTAEHYGGRMEVRREGEWFELCVILLLPKEGS